MAVQSQKMSVFMSTHPHHGCQAPAPPTTSGSSTEASSSLATLRGGCKYSIQRVSPLHLQRRRFIRLVHSRGEQVVPLSSVNSPPQQKGKEEGKEDEGEPGGKNTVPTKDPMTRRMRTRIRRIPDVH